MIIKTLGIGQNTRWKPRGKIADVGSQIIIEMEI